MGDPDPKSRIHDLLATAFGIAGAAILISTKWQVDTSGPYPFYKGPLIFPAMVLSLMVLASMPSAWRLLNPSQQSTWRLDGHGSPRKPAVLVLLMIFFMLGILVFGLEISSFLFTSLGLYYLGHRHPLRFLVLPLFCSVLIVFVFKHVLGVYFPTPLFFDWISE
jgi:hypothetical protein